MTVHVKVEQVERRRRIAVKSRSNHDSHRYFQSVAQARYVLRKVFRLVEAQAKLVGLDPLAHQTLIQIYGSEEGTLQIRQVAERLDIASAFASNMIKMLLKKGYVTCSRDTKDHRVIWISITKDGKHLLHHIDERVQLHVDYFSSQLTQDQRESAISILMFYIGISFSLRRGIRSHSTLGVPARRMS